MWKREVSTERKHKVEMDVVRHKIASGLVGGSGKGCGEKEVILQGHGRLSLT